MPIDPPNSALPRMKARPEESGRPGEFELIARIFAPLARNAPGAFDLTDDVALLTPPPGHEIVLKTDSLIEGVHFRRDDPASTVGRKALRRALSDLAAKGAEPAGYLLALALPRWPDMAWLEEFARGLALDQEEFKLSLVGGETNATPGPVTLTITALGFVRNGALIRRKGAKPGDAVFVTGKIGDAGAGLAVLEQSQHTRQTNLSSPRNYKFLIARYRLPAPRLGFGRSLAGLASASIDVSDGLLADLEHIADVSGVRIEVEANAIPLSAGLRELWGDGPEVRLRAATAGDDYEVAFTVPSAIVAMIREIALGTVTEVTRIGCVVPGEGAVLLDPSGREIALERRGYTHF